MLKKLIVGVVAGILMLGASGSMARVIDAWLVVGLESSSDQVGSNQTNVLKVA